MDQSIQFDLDLIRRYDRSGPRYTSYPTALEFHQQFNADDYRRHIDASNVAGGPLSLYFHLPFCDTVCFFCACNKIITKNRRRAAPYLAHLHQEIATVAALFDSSRVVEQLHWGGGTPTFISHEQMSALMAQTRQHFNLRDDDQGEYSIEIDPREVNDETVALLRSLGFNRMSMGVQDFNPIVQKAVNRIQSKDATFAVLDAARREGFRSVSIDLIYGLPFQTVESFSHTLDEVIAADFDRLSVFNYAHLPERVKIQRQINADDLPDATQKLDILQLTLHKLHQAGYLYIGMDHFAKPEDELAIAQRNNQLYRNFQGYSTHAQCDLIGLGVTSIGNVGAAYIQNIKEIVGYGEAIEAGQLPVFRGVELDQDDFIRRAVITRLICHFSLRFAEIEAQFPIGFTDYFQPELHQLSTMADDGLLEFDHEGITVLPAGRLLIRNICMLFDRYMTSAQKGFSKVI